MVKEEFHFFRLSKWQDKLIEFYSKTQILFYLKLENEVISFVKSGLKDLSVSRKSFNWGIKAPTNNEHVIYVSVRRPNKLS